jgi:hypothetical protein
MLDFEHDEIAERSKQGPSFLAWLGWTIATAAGTVGGLWLVGTLIQARASGRADEVIGLALSGAVIGFAIGTAQALVLFPFLKSKGSIEWVVASVVGRTLYTLAVSQFLEPLLRSLSLERSDALWSCGLLGLILVGVGAMAGLAGSYPQMLVLRDRVTHPEWWLLASMAAGAATRILVALQIFADADSNGLLTGITTGAITGITLVYLLRHPGPGAEWAIATRLDTRRKGSQSEEPQPSPDEILAELRTGKKSLNSPTP